MDPSAPGFSLIDGPFFCKAAVGSAKEEGTGREEGAWENAGESEEDSRGFLVGRGETPAGPSEAISPEVGAGSKCKAETRDSLKVEEGAGGFIGTSPGNAPDGTFGPSSLVEEAGLGVESSAASFRTLSRSSIRWIVFVNLILTGLQPLPFPILMDPIVVTVPPTKLGFSIPAFGRFVPSSLNIPLIAKA